MLGCTKDKDVVETNEIEHATEIRTGSSLDTAWLTDFQEHLIDLRDNNFLTTSFTLSEAIYGSETLLNIINSNSIADENTSYLKDSILFNSSSSNLYNLYTSIRSKVNSQIILNPTDSIVGINVEVDTTIGNIADVDITTIISSGIPTSKSKNCNIFSLDEEYYTGLYGYYKSVPLDIWDYCNTYTTNACGGEEENLTAVEVVEDRINQNRSEIPECNGPGILEESGFYDLKPFDVYLPWNSLFDFNDFKCNESNSNVINDNPRVCDCLNSYTLNEIYANVYEYIDLNTPSGFQFISINLGLDVLLEDVPRGDKRTLLIGDFIIGRPYCIYSYSGGPYEVKDI